ncbi:hypothetical protein BKA56DRAFT_587031 [Ilyonectria sp. MPI-CAGE-AT-0026]|nr:hypothetical protein BKA56DRAFT_587031 [Ilyonectria sp. MPI-CAGE-AT-0026]
MHVSWRAFLALLEATSVARVSLLYLLIARTQGNHAISTRCMQWEIPDVACGWRDASSCVCGYSTCLPSWVELGLVVEAVFQHAISQILSDAEVFAVNSNSA